MVKQAVFVPAKPEPPPPALPAGFPLEFLALAVLAYSEWSENNYAAGWYSIDGLADETIARFAEGAVAELLEDLDPPSPQQIRMALDFKRAWDARFGGSA